MFKDKTVSRVTSTQVGKDGMAQISFVPSQYLSNKAEADWIKSQIGLVSYVEFSQDGISVDYSTEDARPAPALPRRMYIGTLPNGQQVIIGFLMDVVNTAEGSFVRVPLASDNDPKAAPAYNWVPAPAPVVPVPASGTNMDFGAIAANNQQAQFDSAVLSLLHRIADKVDTL